MKTFFVAIIAAVLIISACKSKKKTTTSATTSTSTTTSANTSTVSMGPMMPPKSTDGLYEPGEGELSAVQTQFKEVTMGQLKEGFVIYNYGACIGCHNAKNIYTRRVADWKGIIDDMAQRAAISEAQKDAVYKYVMAMKATQPK
jgi:hypothetical protein